MLSEVGEDVFGIVLPGGMRPRKMGLNWFMPALANNSVGSSWGTTGLAAQNV